MKRKITKMIEIDLNHFRQITEYSKVLECIRHFIRQAQFDYGCLADKYEDFNEELARLETLASTLFIKYHDEVTFMKNFILNGVKDKENYGSIRK